MLRSRFQLNKDLAVTISEVVELLAGLGEVGIHVHGNIIRLDFVYNLPPDYAFVKNNLQSSKELFTCTVLEDALRSRYNVQAGGEKGKVISPNVLFVPCDKNGRRGSRGGKRGEKFGKGGKPNDKERGEESSGVNSLSQPTMTCKYCQKPGRFRPNCPERQCLKGRGWGYEAGSCTSKAQKQK